MIKTRFTYRSLRNWELRVGPFKLTAYVDRDTFEYCRQPPYDAAGKYPYFNWFRMQPHGREWQLSIGAFYLEFSDEEHCFLAEVLRCNPTQEDSRLLASGKVRSWDDLDDWEIRDGVWVRIDESFLVSS